MSLFLHSSNADESAVQGGCGSTLLEGEKWGGGKKNEGMKREITGLWGFVVSPFWISFSYFLNLQIN